MIVFYKGYGAWITHNNGELKEYFGLVEGTFILDDTGDQESIKRLGQTGVWRLEPCYTRTDSATHECFKSGDKNVSFVPYTLKGDKAELGALITKDNVVDGRIDGIAVDAINDSHAILTRADLKGPGDAVKMMAYYTDKFEAKHKRTPDFNELHKILLKEDLSDFGDINIKGAKNRANARKGFKRLFPDKKQKKE